MHTYMCARKRAGVFEASDTDTDTEALAACYSHPTYLHSNCTQALKLQLQATAADLPGPLVAGEHARELQRAAAAAGTAPPRTLPHRRRQ